MDDRTYRERIELERLRGRQRIRHEAHLAHIAVTRTPIFDAVVRQLGQPPLRGAA